MSRNQQMDPIEQSVLNEYDAELDAAGRELLQNPVSQFFGVLDLCLKVKQKKAIIKAQLSSEAKEGNEKASYSLYEIFFAASEYANVPNLKRFLTRFFIMLAPSVIIGLLTTWLIMDRDTHFIDQLNNQSGMIVIGGIFVIDIVLTVLWKKISMPVLRFFMSFFIGGIITILTIIIILVWYGGKEGADTAQLVAIIELCIVGLFFLLWNFMPQTKRSTEDTLPTSDSGDSVNFNDDSDLDDLENSDIFNGYTDMYDDLEEMKK